MGRRLDTEQLRDTIGALDSEGVAVKEIRRRLQSDQAGMERKVDISERQVYSYRADYRKEHGLPSSQIDKDQTAHSIAAIKTRQLELLAREVAALEQVRPGKMTGDQVTTMRRIFSALDDMERRELIAGKRRGKKQRRPASPDKPDSQPESALERIAKQQKATVPTRRDLPRIPKTSETEQAA